MIPRVIHRIWLDDPMPTTFAQFGRAWESQGWELRDWTDSSALPLLANQAHFDKAKQFYPNDWKRFQADLLRLELLYLYGGVYVDTDVQPHQNLDTLLEREKCVVGRSPQSLNGVHPITNAFIAATPEHQFLKACIEAVPKSVSAYSRHHLAMCVGPWMLTRVYEAGNFDITVHEDLYSQGWFTHHWNNAKRKQGKGIG